MGSAEAVHGVIALTDTYSLCAALTPRSICDDPGRWSPTRAGIFLNGQVNQEAAEQRLDESEDGV